MPLKKKGIHWFLTDQEVKVVRDELDSLRATADYEPEKWCLSGLNRKPEALGLALPDHMPKKVKLRDITLRTAEQTAGVVLTIAERLRMLRALLEIGVSSFELTYYARQNAEALREQCKLIKSMNPDAEIEAGQITLKESIDQMVDIGANLIAIKCPPCFGTASIRPGSEVPKAEWEGRDWRSDWRPPRNIPELAERNKPLIDYATKRGIKTCAYISSLPYATKEFLEEYAREMANAGCESIILGDGPGALAPQAFAYAVTIVKRAAPKLKVTVHAHNAFNLGVARCIAGVQAGAEVVEVSVNGSGNLAGQVDLAHAAAAFELLYRVDTGIRLDQLTALRRLGEDIFRVRVATDHSITGDTYFSPEDVLTKFDPWIHTSVAPSVFGNEAREYFAQTANPWEMLDKLTELNIPAEKHEVEAILKEVKAEFLIRKRVLTDDEIRSVAMRVKGAA
ncbi:MAG: hypothetical protein HY525_09755 [Betaproteobacteria bacterium]|nr:hypothetical protein [Betaproteobacteria bacterium]